jgi:nucleoside-diphosphate-sugar epimerase
MLDGKKVLITGHTGRLGGSIAAAFAKRCDLWGLARYSAKGQKDYWEAQGVRTVVGDFARDNLSCLPTDFDYVLNIAANTVPATAMDGLRDNAEGVGVLMTHCRKAKAFLHVSTVGVYSPSKDPYYRYKETDSVGSNYNPLYAGSKLAGEGVAFALARTLNLPTVICRLGAQYGDYGDGGLPGIILSMMETGQPIPMCNPEKVFISLVSNDDVVNFVEPTLKIASVPAAILNWVGDEPVSARDMVDHLSKISGIEGKFAGDFNAWSSFPVDASARRAVTGPCRVPWREGLTKMYADLKAKKKQAGQSVGTQSG